MISEADIFSSVFAPTSVSHTTPTPLSTPLIGASAPGQSFGVPSSPVKQHQNSSAAQLQVQRNLAWSAATRYLSLDGLSLDDSGLGSKHVVTRRRKTREVEEALELLLSTDTEEHIKNEEWDLVGWYMLEVRTHFLSNVAPLIEEAWSKPIPMSDMFNALQMTLLKLTDLQSFYGSRLKDGIIPSIAAHHRRRRSTSAGLDDAGIIVRREKIQDNFEKKLRVLFLHAIPAPRLSSAISSAIYNISTDIFGFNSYDEESQTAERRTDVQLLELLERLQQVGFGNSFGQRAFATAMWRVLDTFVAGQWMKVDWERHQSRLKTLTRFISHGFIPFIQKSIALLGGTPDDICQYQKIAVARLGRLRIANLFDYIVKWDKSLGAVRDIKEYIKTPEARLFLTTSFSNQLQRRLLHAGATTTHILNLYINIIHAFNELDSKGVLLDRVARPIRRYLRQREDTARIIVASLLVDLDEYGKPSADASADISVEIAKEMAKPIVGLDADEDYDMDWDNMEWAPDPVDVSSDFKRSKNQDVTSALLSLYDREDFINELKTILGEHLLRNYDVHEHFEKEERLLELFKNRLGEDKLQACEVMLRDVQSSHQMNKTIHRFPAYNDTTKKVGPIDLNTHILSSFFWPSLRDDEFKLPAPVQALQKTYEEGFEAVKDMRKLKWLTALGRVTVELEFEDRTVEEEVPTWTASVIYAFQSEGTDSSPARSIEQLSDELEMEEALVRNAIVFWRSKQVLQESSPDTFAVIENLSTLDQQGGHAAAAPVLMEEDASVSAVKSQQDLLNENADLYRSFITGMLTNQGNLPLMRMFMMLKVVVPGGFPLGMEEVKALLQGMIDEGKVVGQGDVYGMKRD